jgi:hypothetical protein
MRNNPSNKQTSVGGYLINAVLMVIAGGAMLISIFIIFPFSKIAVQQQFCKNGTIKRDSWGSREKVTCVDKATRKETDISWVEILACCPSAILPGFAIFLTILTQLVFRPGRKSN